MKDYKVLELNADFIPLNLVPLSTISWRDAFKKIVEGVAVPIKYYENEFVHTIDTAYPVPSVSGWVKDVIYTQSWVGSSQYLR